MSSKWKLRFGNFSVFFELQAVFTYRSEKRKKILASIFRSLKCVFPKCKFLRPQLNQRVLVWYLLKSLKALASLEHPVGGRSLRGLHKSAQQEILVTVKKTKFLNN